MDGRRGAPSDSFLRNRKGPLQAVIDKYSKEVPEEDDVVDIFGECLYVDRGSLLNKTSESEFTQVLADFVLHSDIDWSSSSSTITSSSSCSAGSKVLRKLFVRLTDIRKKLSPTADVQPSDSESDSFSGSGSYAADLYSECSTVSSRCSRNRGSHRSPHGQQQQQQYRQSHQQQQQRHPQQQGQQQQHQQHQTRQLQLPVEVQSNPYLLLSPSVEQCSPGRNSRSHQDASTIAAAARAVVDVPPAVEHESGGSGLDRRQVALTNARLSSPVRWTVSGPPKSYSSDCRPRAALPFDSGIDGRRSAAPASHSAASRRPNNYPPKTGEHGSTQAVPGRTSSGSGIFIDAPALRSSLPSATAAHRPQSTPTSPQEKADLRSSSQPAKWSAVADLRSPGGPITSESLSSLGRFMPGERIAIYLRSLADHRSPPISPPRDPSLSPDIATHHLTNCHSVKGISVAETLAVPSMPCNDAFFVGADTGFAERSSMPLGPAATDNASRVMHARHSQARLIMNSEAIVPSPSYGAERLRSSRAIHAEPSGVAHSAALTPSSSSNNSTAISGVQRCRRTLPGVPTARATAYEGDGNLAAPNRVCRRLQSSHGRNVVDLGSADDDSIIELDRAFVSASSNEVTLTAQAMHDDQTRFGALHSLRGSSFRQGGLRQTGSAMQSVAGRHPPVLHDGRNRTSSGNSHLRSYSGESSADEQSETNRAVLAAPDSVEATSAWGRDASPHVRHRRSSSDVASALLPPTAFLGVEPPPGWRIGDSTPPSDHEATEPVPYKHPSDFELYKHSASTLYTPPSDFGTARAADMQLPAAVADRVLYTHSASTVYTPPSYFGDARTADVQLPAAVADCGRRISRDATPSTKPIAQGRRHDPVRLEQRYPHEQRASLTAVEQKFVKQILWSQNTMARKSITGNHQTLPQALPCCWRQPNDGRLGRCSSCVYSTPATPAHAMHLFGASGCSPACCSDRA